MKLENGLLTISKNTLVAAIAGIWLLLSAGHAQAMDVPLPPVNLGDTSFLDGIAFPGWLVEETLDYYHAGQFNDHRGDRAPGPNKLTSLCAVTHVAYLSNFKLLGGYYGAEIVLPISDVQMDIRYGPRARVQGVGDLTFSPFMLEWNDHNIFGMPYFHRFNFDISVPTGKYDRDRPVNIGSNLVSLCPSYAFTLMPHEKFEVSARLHYLWNSENSDPFAGYRADSIQPGQAFFANYAASYEVIKGLRLGVNGYVLQQLTDGKVNGRSQPDSKEGVFGIGLGVMYSYKTVSLYLNGYFETGAQNRPEGGKIVFRISKAL